MKGVIFNVVQEVVEDGFGVDLWDDAVDRAGIEGSFTSLGSYPDSDLVALVGAIADLTGTSVPDVIVLAGRRGFVKLADRHAELLNGMTGWREVLDQLDGIIHPEVRKIYPDASVPSFDAAEHAPDGPVRLEYRSDRHLCALAEGLTLGMGDWFGNELVVEHLSCVHRGDEVCVLEVDEA